MVIVFLSQSRNWSAMPVVPSVRMASLDPMSELLILIDVDHIMAVMGQQNSDWPAQQCLELVTYLWNRSVVVWTFDGWEVGDQD